MPPYRRRLRWRRRAIELLGNNELIFMPFPMENGSPIEILPEEFLAFKLHDLDGKSFEEIGKILNCSRVKASELANEAKKKIVKAFLEKRPIVVKK